MPVSAPTRSPSLVTKEWRFTSSNPDTPVVLVAATATQRIVVTRCSALLSTTSSVNAGVRVGFSSSTLPAALTTGITGIVLSHGKLSRGSGIIEGSGGGILGRGAAGESLVITSDAATSGTLTVMVTYYIINET